MNERKLLDEISLYRDKIRDNRLNAKFLTSDSVIACINLVENIAEHLGIFKEIINDIKVDLIEFIFSHKLTADERSQSSLIERVPYFMLYLKSEENQRLLLNDSKNIVEDFNDRINKIEMELKKVNDNNKAKEMECQKLHHDIADYQNIIEEMKMENESLQVCNEELTKEMNEVVSQIEKDNENLKMNLIKQQNIVKDIQVYKTSHDHLDKVFMEACQNINENPAEKKIDPFNKKNNLESEIKAIIVMQQDLITLENRLLDDFDRRLADFKKAMLTYESSREQVTELFSTDEPQSDVQMSKMMIEFNKAKTYFKNECMQLEFESLMLENHQMVLVNDLTVIHQSELDIDQKGRSDHKEIRESFIIDEKLMSKYSAIIYISSNGGETYYESKETIFCESCGGKIVFCPHHIANNKVLKLPIGSTHIKIQRPEIKINAKFAKFMAPKSQFNKQVKTDTEKSVDDRKTMSSRKSQRSSINSNESEMALPFEVLLEDLENRTKMSRSSPRSFDETKILSIFEDFWAVILIEDEFDAQMSDISTTYDKIYIFFLDRYVNERAAMLSLFDFLSSLIETAENSQLIQLFCHILLANIDSSVMRYLFHMVDCIDIVHWSGENDLRNFIDAVYPFLNEDEVDSLVLSYISFSENVYNKSNMFEFIMYNILKQRDPRFIMIKTEASEFKTVVAGYFSIKEFNILLESLASLPNKKLSMRLFKELALLYTDDGEKEMAPLSKITHIISFLSFLESSDNTKHILREQYSSSSDNKVELMRWGYTRLKNLSKQLQKDA